MENFYCDVCGKLLEKKEKQRHHLIPKLLRRNNEDNELQVDVCPVCHLRFHKVVNFADVVKKTKIYFIKEYTVYRQQFIKERNIYLTYLRGRK